MLTPHRNARIIGFYCDAEERTNDEKNSMIILQEKKNKHGFNLSNRHQNTLHR